MYSIPNEEARSAADQAFTTKSTQTSWVFVFEVVFDFDVLVDRGTGRQLKIPASKMNEA